MLLFLITFFLEKKKEFLCILKGMKQTQKHFIFRTKNNGWIKVNIIGQYRKIYYRLKFGF